MVASTGLGWPDKEVRESTGLGWPAQHDEGEESTAGRPSGTSEGRIVGRVDDSVHKPGDEKSVDSASQPKYGASASDAG